MKEFIVTSTGTAKSTQTWIVKAKNEQDAIERYKRGDGSFDGEETYDFESSSVDAELNE